MSNFALKAAHILVAFLLPIFLSTACSGDDPPTQTPVLQTIIATTPLPTNTPAIPPTPDPQRDLNTAIAFYHATGGPDWEYPYNRLWDPDTPISDWRGLTTDHQGHITAIILQNTGLTGPAPAFIASLLTLTTLDLSHNRLSGTIPDTFSRLTNLTTLDLSNNALEGPIPPSLAGLSTLPELHLQNNLITGPIPGKLAASPALETIHISGNPMTDACYPKQFRGRIALTWQGPPLPPCP